MAQEQKYLLVLFVSISQFEQFSGVLEFQDGGCVRLMRWFPRHVTSSPYFADFN